MTRPDNATLSRETVAALAAHDPAHPLDRFDFPLAFAVDLPEGAFATRGDLGVRFHDFLLTGLACARATPRADGFELNFPALGFHGRCTLTAKSAPEIALDTGGGLMEFGDDDIGTGGGPTDPLDPQKKEAMLEQARTERARLMDSEKGRKLMGEYNEHNEVFNSVFVKSTAARNAWTANGATKDMAEHTHVALGDDDQSVTIVNPKANEKTFGTKGVTYNQNAFVQQLQIVVNTISQDPTFNPWDPHSKLDPESKYVKASLSAMSFGKATEKTGNTPKAIKPMSGPEVYGSVDAEDGEMPDTSVDELESVIAQGVQDGGRAAVEAEDNGWRVLDQADRQLVRRHLYLSALERAAEAENHPRDLWTGAAGAEIRGAKVRVRTSADPEVDVALPAFEFDIDDSAWTGTAGNVARDRLAEVAFARSFLLDRVETALADATLRALRTART